MRAQRAVTLTDRSVRHNACSPLPPRSAKLTTAVGSYAELPQVALLVQYMPEDERRAFVESMALVKIKQGECIMRQGAVLARNLQ